MSSTVGLSDTSALVPDVQFESIHALFRRLDEMAADHQSDSLVVGKLSEQNFLAMEAKRDRSGRQYRFFYLHDLAYAIITIPTGRHEEAHRGLFDFVTDKFRDMGLRNQWANIGSETFKTRHGSCGEGDSPGGPRSRYRGGIQDWPTLVIEAGATQAMPSLRIKAMWWFAQSDYRMKVVVLVKLLPAVHSIKIEKWITQAGHLQRQGATTTRASQGAARQPILDQQVLIDWAGPAPLPQTPLDNRLPASFRVDGAPLVLRFEDLMERQPDAATGEHDILILETDLQLLALHVWDRV